MATRACDSAIHHSTHSTRPIFTLVTAEISIGICMGRPDLVQSLWLIITVRDRRKNRRSEGVFVRARKSDILPKFECVLSSLWANYRDIASLSRWVVESRMTRLEVMSSLLAREERTIKTAHLIQWRTWGIMTGSLQGNSTECHLFSLTFTLPISQES